MTGRRVLVAMAASALVAVGCGQPAARPALRPSPTRSPAARPSSRPASSPAATPSGFIQPTPWPTPVPTPWPTSAVSLSQSGWTAPAMPALQAVVIETNGQNTVLHLVSLTGRQLGSATLDPGDPDAAGPGGAYYVHDGHMWRLGMDGSVTDLGAVPISTEGGGQFAISPDGRQWVYPTMGGSGSVWQNQLWIGGIGEKPRLLAQRPGLTPPSEEPPTDAPSQWQYMLLGWDASGIFVVRELEGICGCGPFADRYQVHVALVDPATGDATDLADDGSCPVSGTPAADGTYVCFTSTPGPPGGAAGMRVVQHRQQVAYFTLSGDNRAGGVVFDPGTGQIAYDTYPVSATSIGGIFSDLQLRVIDLATGAAHAVGPTGLIPAGWLADGRIVATRYPSDDMTKTSVVSVDPTTGAVTTLLSGGAYVVGLASAG